MKLPVTDSELVALSKKGNTLSFGELVKKYEKFVYNTAYAFLLNREDAFDVSQNSFIKAWRNISSFEEKSSFSTWIYRITVNSAKDFLVSKNKNSTLEIDEQVKDLSSPESEYIKKESLSNIEMAINSLEEDLKEVVLLREIEELSYNEISEVLEIELGTVKSRLSRARAKLREVLLEQKESFPVK